MASTRFNSNHDSNSNAVENFCLIGTPLPPLDSKKADPNELKPIWKQEVRDQQGRQRFHGAFTGGYSAGYFNTVGSKEGWTPSTFISSRSKKKDEANSGSAPGSFKGARPEDFMDDEDLDDLREKRELKNNAGFQYDGISGAREGGIGIQEDEEDPLASLLKSNPPAPSQSIGVSILKKMGWKEGHGLGPKLTFSKRNKLLNLLGMKTLSKDELPDASNQNQREKAIFPPPDTRIPNATNSQERKRNDLHGLGWVGNETLEMALNRVRNSNPNRQSEDQSKGLDLDEEEGEDSTFVKSIGVYGDKDDIRKSTLNLSNKERIALGMKNDDRPADAKSNSSNHLRGMDLNSGNSWRDGREVLKGFRVSIKSQVADEWHEPPPIPQGWKPDPTRVWNLIRNQDSSAPFTSSFQGNLGPEQRAELLGEARIPGPPPSLKDYISKSSSTPSPTFIQPSSIPTSTVTPQSAVSIPTLEASVASSALKGFLPFSNDQEKQKRYLDFLKSNVPGSGIENPTQGKDQSNDQFEKELEDFVKMARVFKPMSIAMSNRFTSSSSNEGLGNGKVGIVNDPDSLGGLPKSGLYQPVFKDDDKEEDERKKKKRRIFETEEEKVSREEKEKKDFLDGLTPSQRAAREGRFGKDTRTISNWYPNKLLCKRFNVPDPYPNRNQKNNEEENPSSGDQDFDSGSSSLPSAFGGRKGKEKAHEDELSRPKVDEMWNSKKSEFREMVQDQAWNRFSNPDSGTTTTTPSDSTSPRKVEFDKSKLKNTPMSLENVGLGEDENQGRDTLSYVKPSMDIFKAVFGDDDDDDDDSEGEGQEKVEGEKQIRADPRSVDAKDQTASSTENQDMKNKTEEEKEKEKESTKLIFKPKTQRNSINEKVNQVSSFSNLDGSEMELEVGNAITTQGEGTRKSKGKSTKSAKKKGLGKVKGMLTFDVDEDEGSGSSTFRLEKRKLNREADGNGDGEGRKEETSKETGNNRKRQKASDLF